MTGRPTFDRRQVLKTSAVLGVVGLAGCTGDDPANFEVNDASSNDPTYRGEEFEVEVTIHNTGEQEDTQTVTLRTYGGDEYDSTEVTLDGDERTDVRFVVDSTDFETQPYTFVVETDDDDDTTDVSIDDALVVADTSVDDEDGYISMRVDVENRASVTASGTLVGEITSDAFDQPYTDEQEVDLDGGETDTVDLRIHYETDESIFMYSHDAWIEN